MRNPVPRALSHVSRSALGLASIQIAEINRIISVDDVAHAPDS